MARQEILSLTPEQAATCSRRLEIEPLKPQDYRPDTVIPHVSEIILREVIHCLVCHRNYPDQEAATKHKRWCDGFTSRCREGCPDDQPEDPSSHEVHLERRAPG